MQEPTVTLEEMKVIAELQIGTLIAITHVFNCLHHRGVLPLADAISSLEQTEQGLPSDVPQTTRGVIQNLVAGLRLQQGHQTPPDPDRPPPATRPDLQVIQGGRNE
jgi:hypothetical protein